MAGKIKNFEQLAVSSLRRQALLVAEAGLLAVDTATAVRRQIKLDGKKQRLEILGRKTDIADFKNIVLLGFGKAALAAGREIYNLLGSRITAGYVIDILDGNISPNIISRAGTHPLASEQNADFTREFISLVEKYASADTLFLTIVSGGGSALLCLPHEMTAETQAKIFKGLTAAGADIFELNVVRKHISQVKGGQLAKAMYPAASVNLIFSDVPGDDISTVASGPTVKDESSAHQAKQIIDKYNILEACGLSSIKFVETPKEEKFFKKVRNVLFVSAKTALAAMKEKAEELGLDAKIYSDHFQGEAREIVLDIIAANKKGCLLGAGESTVKIIGDGKGGRNQELSLAALSSLHENQVLLTLASDGRDNTEAAGAIVDQSTEIRALALGLDPHPFLENNDSFSFFEKLGDQIITGPTGSNISDLFVCIKGN